MLSERKPSVAGRLRLGSEFRLDAIELLEQLRRQAPAVALQVLANVRDFLFPERGFDTQQSLQIGIADAEAASVDVLRPRQIADRGFVRADLAGDTPEHPLEHAQVFAVS